MLRWLLLAGLSLAGLGLAWIPRAFAQPDQTPEKYRATAKKGLEWLAKQQQADGSWTMRDQQYPTALTSLAGLALLMEGSTTAQGTYAPALRQAVHYVLKQSQDDEKQAGLICDLRNASESGRYMFGHGYGLLFLACVFAEEEDPARRRRIKDVLTRAIEFTGQAQTSRGGWYYTSARAGGDQDEGATTLVQLQALRAARDAGLPVPKKMLAQAMDYMEKCTGDGGGVFYSSNSKNERPGLTAGALACAGQVDHPLAKKWWAHCKRQIVLPVERRGLIQDDFTFLYYSQAVYALGDQGYGRLFPKDNDPIQWSKYRETLFDHLLRAQNNDGSWHNSGGFNVGPVYTTAVYLIILQLDNEALPLICRRQ